MVKGTKKKNSRNEEYIPLIRSATSASVDELQKAIGSIDLTMSTLPVSSTTRVSDIQF